MRTLIVATKNKKKLHELKRYLKTVRAKIISLKELGRVPRIVENGDTFKKNAAKKALVVSKATGGLVIADDSGLCVKAICGAPGVKSARFAGPGKKDSDNTAKLLNLMEGVPASKRGARFVCAVAIADNGRVVKLIEDSCSGKIALSSRGRHGFGYDPVFLIPEYGRTFGEMGLKVKDRMSHRSKALRKARKFLKEYLQ
jgi:XTP/dITP diphosphohydrolase